MDPQLEVWNEIAALPEKSQLLWGFYHDYALDIDFLELPSEGFEEMLEQLYVEVEILKVR